MSKYWNHLTLRTVKWTLNRPFDCLPESNSCKSPINMVDARSILLLSFCFLVKNLKFSRSYHQEPDHCPYVSAVPLILEKFLGRWYPVMTANNPGKRGSDDPCLVVDLFLLKASYGKCDSKVPNIQKLWFVYTQVELRVWARIWRRIFLKAYKGFGASKHAQGYFTT